MDINLKGNKAKYIELYEEITRLINSGELKSGTKLPSKRDLSIDLNVSLNTVINAYDLLIDEGYIYSVEKKGYYVSDQSSIEIKPIAEPITSKREDTYNYDFTTRNVESFNNTNYRKIVRSLLNDNEFLNKTDFNGDLGLRTAISDHLRLNRGINVSPDLIFISSGIESLRSVLRILNIDNITLENPGYHKLAALAYNLSLKVNYIDVDENGTMVPNNKTILYTTPFNQFPTGIKMSIPRKKELLSFAERTDSYIIEDDFDAEFRIKEAPTTSLYTLSPLRVIFFSTFTMTLYPGLRISYFILPPSIKDIYLHHYKGYSSNVPTLEQLALRDFIREGYYASHINRRKKEYLRKREIIINYLKKNNIDVDEKKNYLSILINTNKDTDKIINNAKKRGLIADTLKNYDINNKDNGIIILGYTSIKEDDITKGLDILIEEIKAQ